MHIFWILAYALKEDLSFKIILDVSLVKIMHKTVSYNIYHYSDIEIKLGFF